MFVLFREYLDHVGACESQNKPNGRIATDTVTATTSTNPIVQLVERSQAAKKKITMGPEIYPDDAIQYFSELSDLYTHIAENIGKDAIDNVDMAQLETMLRGNEISEGLSIRLTLSSMHWHTSQEGQLDDPIPEAHGRHIERKRLLGEMVGTMSFYLQAAIYMFRWGRGGKRDPVGYNELTPEILLGALGKWWAIPTRPHGVPICDWDVGTTYEALRLLCLRFCVPRAESAGVDWRTYYTYVTALYHHVCRLTTTKVPSKLLRNPLSPNWCTFHAGFDDAVLANHAASDEFESTKNMSRTATSLRVREHMKRENERAAAAGARDNDFYIERKRVEKEKAKEKANQMRRDADAKESGIVPNSHLRDMELKDMVKALSELSEEVRASEIVNIAIEDVDEEDRKSGKDTSKETEAEKVERVEAAIAKRNMEIRLEELERTKFSDTDEITALLKSALTSDFDEEMRSKAHKDYRDDVDGLEEVSADDEEGETLIQWVGDIMMVLDNALAQLYFVPKYNKRNDTLVSLSEKTVQLRSKVKETIFYNIQSVEQGNLLRKMRAWITLNLTSETERYLFTHGRRNLSFGVYDLPSVRIYTRGDPETGVDGGAMAYNTTGKLSNEWFNTTLESVQERNPWYDWVMAFGFTYTLKQTIPGIIPSRTIWANDIEIEGFGRDRLVFGEPRLVHVKGQWGVMSGWSDESLATPGISAVWFTNFVDAATIFLWTIKTNYGGMVHDTFTGTEYKITDGRTWKMLSERR